VLCSFDPFEKSWAPISRAQSSPDLDAVHESISGYSPAKMRNTRFAWCCRYSKSRVSMGTVEDSDIRCERLAVGNMFGVAVPGFSISTSHVSTDSSRVCANPLVPW
jgi:hypothetical protein